MPQVTFIEHSGAEHVVQAEAGQTLMQAATGNMVPGVVADCGGCCTCATCHVYVDAAWADRVPAPGDEEKSMLECVLDPGPTSRLSCQIKLGTELSGLVVRLPAAQF
jgi:2Fe-2S ferredoxin